MPASHTGHTIPSPLMSAQDAAAYLQLQVRTLANWRVLGKGPRFVRSGSRVFYRQSALDDWLEAHTYQHIADERERRASGQD